MADEEKVYKSEAIYGKLYVGQISGPVLGGQIVINTPDGEVSLDSFLRSYLGKVVSIHISEEPGDAQLEGSSSDRQLKYTSGR